MCGSWSVTIATVRVQWKKEKNYGCRISDIKKSYCTVWPKLIFTLEICCTFNCVLESMAIFHKISTYGQGQCHRNKKLAQMCHFVSHTSYLSLIFYNLFSYCHRAWSFLTLLQCPSNTNKLLLQNIFTVKSILTKRNLILQWNFLEYLLHTFHAFKCFCLSLWNYVTH